MDNTTVSYKINNTKPYVQVDVTVELNNGFGAIYNGTMRLKDWDNMSKNDIINTIIKGRK